MGTNMKTLNLNKLTILLGLFLVSAFFTTGANAACVVNADGAIVTASENSAAPVKGRALSQDTRMTAPPLSMLPEMQPLTV